MDESKDTISYGRGWHRHYTETPNELFDDQCTLNTTQGMIYIYLLSCVNEQRNGCTAWPSYDRIAKKVRIHRTTAIDSIKVLVEKQYLFKKSRTVSGAHTSNMYLINHPSYTVDFNHNI